MALIGATPFLVHAQTAATKPSTLLLCYTQQPNYKPLIIFKGAHYQPMPSPNTKAN
ncbi:hypothetical protein HMPREF1991_00737 [Hoylesella loescheii DSM 19665 = JCM 12249 = ATCC 15930]|uniref:Uncharacterized protein n=1 Tax=Hoylesella loescheii DSM 19665 = JCM 12249 = ATCC 15930 TaxID=1122985 RepID=A0A069QTM1_HOYLO|nr:hypothetical protein HMPREF1991_00737 [Hoylesella loescheii DSM 19665 = JCM 12249 = ATCC 15930]